MLLQGLKSAVNRSFIFSNEPGETNGPFFISYIPEIHHPAFELHVCPRVPYPHVVAMIGRVDAGKHVAFRAPERMNKSASFEHRVHPLWRIYCFIIIL